MAKKVKPTITTWQDHAKYIATKIKAELKKRDWWSYNLADKLGESPAAISHIMTGRRNLTLGTLVRLEQALDIKLLGNFPNEFKDCLQDTLNTVSGNIHHYELQILDAVKQRDDSALEAARAELAKLEAVKQFIDNLITRFPELAG